MRRARGWEDLGSAWGTQRRIEDFEGGGLSLSGLAQLSFAQGEGARALDPYREALESFGKVGDQPEIARVHGEMGWVALAMHRQSESRQFFLNALRTNDQVGSARGTGLALMGLAATEASEGNDENAVTIAAAADVLSEQIGVVVEHPMGPGAGDQIEAVKSRLSGELVEVLTTRGASMSVAEVLKMVTGPRRRVGSGAVGAQRDPAMRTR